MPSPRLWTLAGYIIYLQGTYYLHVYVNFATFNGHRQPQIFTPSIYFATACSETIFLSGSVSTIYTSNIPNSMLLKIMNKHSILRLHILFSLTMNRVYICIGRWRNNTTNESEFQNPENSRSFCSHNVRQGTNEKSGRMEIIDNLKDWCRYKYTIGFYPNATATIPVLWYGLEHFFPLDEQWDLPSSGTLRSVEC